MILKKILTAFLVLFAITVMATCSLADSGDDVNRHDAKRDAQLANERCASLWIDGRRMGELIVGASAKMEFQFVDKKLIHRIYAAAENFPETMSWNASYYDKAAKLKCNLVILHYKAISWWNFDPAKITVNGEPLPKKQILSSMLSVHTGQLSPNTEEVIAFGVPREISKPGKTLTFGYEEASVELKIPSSR